MDGTIWVESALGKGSSFFFDFRAQGRKEQTESSRQIFSYPPKILVVDDDPDTLMFFHVFTEQIGARCDTAINGNEALSLLQKNDDYDVYFIDYKLPDMNGAALAEAMQNVTKNDLHIVLISGLDRSSIEKECDLARIDHFLTKPLFPSDLRDAINEFMGTEKAAAPVLPDNTVACFAGYRVLLAEDIDINREIFFVLLEDTGLDIDIAENGRIALEKFKASPESYNLILMDVQMPEMDGYEAAAAIRGLEFPYAGELPIVAMTANVFKEDVEKCLASGMNDHIGKPFDQQVIMEKLHKYLERHAAGNYSSLG
jgi:CheY-like chemotaxis protein